MRHNVRYRIINFRNLNPCNLADRYQHFRGTSCLHFLSWRWWQQVPPHMLALIYQTIRSHFPGGCKFCFVQQEWYTLEPAFVQLGTDILQNTDLHLILYWYWMINDQLSKMISNLWSVFIHCYQTPNNGKLFSWTLALRLNAFICTSFIYVVIMFFRINKN